MTTERWPGEILVDPFHESTPGGTISISRRRVLPILLDLIPLVSGTSLVFLALLGGLAAHAGGAGMTVGAIRVTFWGGLAMALTAVVGVLLGTIV